MAQYHLESVIEQYVSSIKCIAYSDLTGEAAGSSQWHQITEPYMCLHQLSCCPFFADTKVQPTVSRKMNKKNKKNKIEKYPRGFTTEPLLDIVYF